MLKINEQPTATVVPAELPVTISKNYIFVYNWVL